MATLTDEEKAKEILGDVEDPRPGETTEEPEANPDTETEEPETETTDEETPDEEKPTEGETETEETVDSTFTKQFPNLKGETLAEYTPELEKAYDNSFKEALRLDKENKELRQALVTAQAGVVAPPTAPPDPTNPASPQQQPAPNPAFNAIDEHPAIQYAKAKQTEDMMTAFDDFKKNYPQATEQQSFEQFKKASDGIAQALTSALGRAPTYKELFPAIAGSLGWQATTPNTKGAIIKENASSGRSSGAQSPAPSRAPRVSDDEIEAYQKMFTSKTREEAIKDLSEVKV